MKSRLGNLRLYKLDVPCESDVGVLVVSYDDHHISDKFQLSRYTGRGGGRGSKTGLSRSFVNLVSELFMMNSESNITKQIFDYIVSNLSFKDLEMVPPACPVLVFHFQVRGYGQDHAPQMDMTVLARILLNTLRTRDSILCVEDAVTRLVPIAPPTTEIIDCYKTPDELCCLCGKGYPREDEIVHRTKCNHIFHATCISRYLLGTPQCPLCSAELLPVDVRTLLFF